MPTYRNTALKLTKDVVKVSPGVISGIQVYNQDATLTYLHFFDALTANVTVGTTTPTFSFAVPASGWWDQWVAASDGDDGVFSFANGLVIDASTALANTGAPTNGLLVNLVMI